MGKVQRIANATPNDKFFWRALSPEEWKILNETPHDYGRLADELKELAKAKKLKDRKCVQMSTDEREARKWMENEKWVLIQVRKEGLSDDEFEIVEGHHFVFVTGEAVVRLKEVVT